MKSAPQSTARLRFREPTPADAAFYLRLMNDPVYHRFIGDRGLRNLENAETYIRDKLLPSFSQKGFGLWLVEEIASGEPVGMNGLVDRDGFEEPDLGYAFVETARGKGYARESVVAVQGFATRTLGLTGLPAYIHPDNAASAKVLEQTAFVKAGTIIWPTTGDPAVKYEWFA